MAHEYDKSLRDDMWITYLKNMDGDLFHYYERNRGSERLKVSHNMTKLWRTKASQIPGSYYKYLVMQG